MLIPSSHVGEHPRRTPGAARGGARPPSASWWMRVVAESMEKSVDDGDSARTARGHQNFDEDAADSTPSNPPSLSSFAPTAAKPASFCMRQRGM